MVVLQWLHGAPPDVDLEAAGAELLVARRTLAVLRRPHTAHRFFVLQPQIRIRFPGGAALIPMS